MQDYSALFKCSFVSHTISFAVISKPYHTITVLLENIAESARSTESPQPTTSAPPCPVHECGDKTRGDCLEDMTVRFSGRNIPEGLSPAKRREFIDSVLNDPSVKHRFVFRQWPLIPSHPIIKPENPLMAKTAPNGIRWWGSTLFDFFNVRWMVNERSLTTGNKLLRWSKENCEYEANAEAKDYIAWAEKEKDPELVPVYNIANLIKNIENSAFSDKNTAEEEEDQMRGDTDSTTTKKHDIDAEEELTLPQPVSYQWPINHL